MDCFGTYFTHVQTCNVPRVQSATECALGFRITLRGDLRKAQGHLKGLTSGLRGGFSGELKVTLKVKEGSRLASGDRTALVKFRGRLNVWTSAPENLLGVLFNHYGVADNRTW